jgi:hypothetical protein
VVSTLTRLQADNWKIKVLFSAVAEIFLFTTVSRLAMELTQLIIQWVPGAFLWGQCSQCVAEPLSSAEVKDVWSHISTSAYVFMVCSILNHKTTVPLPYSHV